MASKYGFGFKSKEEQNRRDEEQRARDRAKAERERQRERARNQNNSGGDHWRRQWERARSNSNVYSAAGVPMQDRPMALEIINAGLRALTRKHHPDLGGNHEDMVKVNRAVEALRKVVG